MNYFINIYIEISYLQNMYMRAHTKRIYIQQECPCMGQNKQKKQLLIKVERLLSRRDQKKNNNR